jgi:hypothetical protein
MPVAARLGAILVAVVVVVAVAFLVIRAGGAEIGVGPESTATASPSASEAATPSTSPRGSAGASADPSAPSEAEALAVLAEIEDQVIAIRGLEAADIGPPEIITRAELAVELEQLFEEDYPPEEQRRDNIVLRALGLLEPGQDVAELQLELLGDQVLGFYDDTDKRMVVVSDAGLDVEARITYAHEYTHALQDAAFGLDSLQTDAPGEDDRGLARTALIEGDASITMLAWMFQHLTPQEIQQYTLGAEIPDMSGVPSWMVEQLAFPYDDGLNWAVVLAGGDPFSPDFGAIDAAYGDPPASTEQIIDMAKWEARESPRAVDVPDLAAALGEDWGEVDETPIGQATIEIMLRYLGVGGEEAVAASTGWGGDRAVIVSGPDDQFAVAWRLAWDAPAEAAEFVDAYQIVVDGLDFPASVTELPNGEVLVAHASDEELLDLTVDAAN